MSRLGGPLESQLELRAFVESDTGLSKLLSEVSSYLATEPEHDLSHALRVALWTVRIGGSEISVRDAVAAALCHDLVCSPKDSPEKSADAAKSARVARQLLPKYGFSPESVCTIALAVEDHSYSRWVKPKTPLGRALQDADRLEALGAIGIMRTLSTGGALKRSLLCSEDPWASDRAFNDRMYSLDHFFTKLLRIQHSMCTDLGQQEADRRTQVLEAFLKELAFELEAELPPIDALVDRPVHAVSITPESVAYE